MQRSITFAIIFFSAMDNLLGQNLLTTLLPGLKARFLDTVIRVGLITVPFDVLCKNDLTSNDTCRICMLDCIYAHNATFGNCGPHPTLPDETTCRCYYSKLRPRPSVTSICDSALSDESTDLVLAGALRLRFRSLLCSDTIKGCRVDCRENHGLTTGKCIDDYCLCSY